MQDPGLIVNLYTELAPGDVGICYQYDQQDHKTCDDAKSFVGICP